MAETIIIKPSSGDSYASLFRSADSTDAVLETVSKGTVLKLIGSTGNFFEVEYDNGLENVTQGGTGNTGTLVAYPYASMYDDSSKNNIIAKVNNGTVITIEDDSLDSIIKIKAFTTEGWKSGYVDAKYIYRDIEEETEVSTFDLRRDITPRATKTGTIMSAGLNARSGPGTNYSVVGTFAAKATVTILETKSGWHRVSGTSTSGTLIDVWVSSQYVAESNSNSTAMVSKTDSVKLASSLANIGQAVANVFTDTFGSNESTTYFSNYDFDGNKYTANDEYYRQLSDKYMFALGTPPKYNMDIDIQYVDEIAAGSGRVINKTILANPTLLSICPGKVAMFPELMGTDRDTMFEAMLQASEGNSSLKGKIEADDGAKFSGRLYKFEADTAEYAKYLNALCRAVSIMLGIGDQLMPNTTSKLKDFDYQYWTIRKKYNPTAAQGSDSDGTIFRRFWDSLIEPGKRLLSTAVDDTTYINFFINGSETSVSENISNSVTESPLSSVANPISDIGAKINYFTGGGFDVGGEEASRAIETALGAGEGFEGILNLGKNFLKGGRMILPKMVEGASYSKSISCNMKFVSPYGDPYSVFIKCLVPICHILAMSLPKQLSDNMFTYPFLVRCAQLGSFNVDLGIISGLTINRGGSDDTSWTIDKLATEWEVQLEITPLVDELMITSTSNPVLFCKNEMLLDYLANFCGFDMLAYNLDTKIDLMKTFITHKVLDWGDSLENKLSDTLFNKVNNIFRYSL